MDLLGSIVGDLVATFGSIETAAMFGEEPSDDVVQQLVWKLREEDRTSELALRELLEDRLGGYNIGRVLKQQRIKFDINASVGRLMDEWLRFHNAKISRPKARPQELTAAIAELAEQIGTTPEKFESIDVLLTRLALLLRYILFFYTTELVACVSRQGLCTTWGVSAEACTHTATVGQLSIEQLCELLLCDEPLRCEPYKVKSPKSVTLADDDIAQLLRKIATMAAADERDGRSLAKIASEIVLALLRRWQATVIPRGAILTEVSGDRYGRRAICQDEFNRPVSLFGFSTPMETGDNVLLALSDEKVITAPKIKPVPDDELWHTPGQSVYGTAVSVEAEPSYSLKEAPKGVFISYAHEDRAWADRINVHLKPLENKGMIELWRDTRMEPGEVWEKGIQAALDKSSVFILLLSADFVGSDFIMKRELPALLEARRHRDVKIIPVVVGKAYFKVHDELSEIQTLNDPERPLQGLSEHERNECLTLLTEKLSVYCRWGHRFAG